MSKLQLIKSLNDVLPTFSGDYPPPLLSYVESLHLLSMQKLPSLPHKADAARYHLCAYLAAEKYQDRFNLPQPTLAMIPANPKVVDRLLKDILDKVLLTMSSPTTTPRKPALSSPTKRSFTPSIGSPLKKLQKLQNGTAKSPLQDLKSPFDAASPFNVDGKTQQPLSLGEKSPFMQAALLTPLGSPTKSPTKSPAKTPLTKLKSTASTPSSPRYLRHLSVADFISFANNFYIPATVTPHLLETFMIEKHKFMKKNEWLLACGLIHSAYVRINDKYIKTQIGKKAEIKDQLFQYQKGGLMKANMVMWLDIVEESIKSEHWAIDLELKYVHNDWSLEDTTQEQEIMAKLGPGWKLHLMLGSMIGPSVMFDKESQVQYYQTWTERVQEKLAKI